MKSIIALFIRLIVSTFCLIISVGCIKKETTPFFLPWLNNQQLVIVVTDSWDSNKGTMILSQYHEKKWDIYPKKLNVVLGKNGLAKDSSQNFPTDHSVLEKREGDHRSPAGVFKIGNSFGYAEQSKFSYPYTKMDSNDYCVDDPHSIYYNQIINISNLSNDHIPSSGERMRRDLEYYSDNLYQYGLFINYNQTHLSYKGSCIFIHIKKQNPLYFTEGCTALEKIDLEFLLSWLKPTYNPILIVLPISEYNFLKTGWNLPELKN